MPRTIARSLAVASCLILTVAACSKKVDTASVESQVVTNVKSVYPDVKVVTADCPGNVKAKEGRSFSCKLKLDGQSTEVAIRITKVTDKRFTFSLKRTQAIISTKAFVADLKKQLGSKRTVDCGTDTVLIKSPGETISCKVTTGGQTEQLKFKVADTDGRVEVQK